MLGAVEAEERLADARVWVLDAQASGATPALGALLELGFGEANAAGIVSEVRARWVTTPPETQVPRAVRRLTGWSEEALASSVPPRVLWGELLDALAEQPRPARAVIHFATFELRFLRALHDEVSPGSPFPLDVVCLHALARRLLPDLPRRGLRALAGYLGHSPSQLRRAEGHVLATAAAWAGIVPLLAGKNVHTWTELREFLTTKPPRLGRAVPLDAAVRNALPKGPGVYRLLRSNGDVLYVGKAASVRARVSSHVSGRRRGGEQALEMLTQLRDVEATETATALEAALLESDEIKRLDPPYNVHLRVGPRRVWFADRAFGSVSGAADAEHRVGPLPSARGVEALGAIGALLEGAASTAALRASATWGPAAFAPEGDVFDEGFRVFVETRLAVDARTTRVRLLRAARVAWSALADGDDADEEAGVEEGEDEDVAAEAIGWTAIGVTSALDRALAQAGRLVRRARLVCVLADARVAFREPEMRGARLLVLRAGVITAEGDLAGVDALTAELSAEGEGTRARLSWAERRACFDVAGYDRVRVLATELSRVDKAGGDVAIAVGRTVIRGPRAARLLACA